MIQIEAIWQKLRSNPTFVVISRLFFGAVGDTIFEEIQSGKLDLSKAGLHRILVSAAGTAFVAWWHLYQPAPASAQGQASLSSDPVSSSQPSEYPASQSFRPLQPPPSVSLISPESKLDPEVTDAPVTV